MITLFVAAVVVAKNNNNYPFFIVALMFVHSFSKQITSTALSTQLCRQWSPACVPFKTLALKSCRI